MIVLKIVKQLSLEKLKLYVDQICSTESEVIEVKSSEAEIQEARKRSFKIKIVESKAGPILNRENWPDRIVIRRWWQDRRTNVSGALNASGKEASTAKVDVRKVGESGRGSVQATSTEDNAMETVHIDA